MPGGEPPERAEYETHNVVDDKDVRAQLDGVRLRIVLRTSLRAASLGECRVRR